MTVQWRSHSVTRFSTRANLVMTAGHDSEEAEAVFTKELELLDSLISGYREDSELSILNRQNRGRPNSVSPQLYELISVACSASALTGGMNDPLLGRRVLVLELPDRVTGRPPRVRITRSGGGSLARSSMGEIVLDPKSKTVQFPRDSLIDLHSVGKAFWADRLAEEFSERYGGAVVIDIGGDIAVFQPEGEASAGIPIEVQAGWPVGSYRETVLIQSGGIATSGGLRPDTLSPDTSGRGHIVDPKSGQLVAMPPATATVAASKCWIANAYSTAIIASGPKAEIFANQAGQAALIVRSDGLVTRTRSWPAKMEGFSEEVLRTLDQAGTQR